MAIEGFTRLVAGQLARAKLKEAIISKITWAIGGVFTVVSSFLDIGGTIFDFIDARDKKPNNGLLDF